MHLRLCMYYIHTYRLQYLISYSQKQGTHNTVQCTHRHTHTHMDVNPRAEKKGFQWEPLVPLLATSPSFCMAADLEMMGKFGSWSCISIARLSSRSDLCPCVAAPKSQLGARSSTPLPASRDESTVRLVAPNCSRQGRDAMN